MARNRTSYDRISWQLALVGLTALALVGCQQKMADQPSYKPLEPNDFFDDGLSARRLVEGTVARGHLQVDAAFFTGRFEPNGGQSVEGESADGAGPRDEPSGEPAPGGADAAARKFDEDRAFVTELPIPATEALLTHGFNRYMIYCTVCHDPLATGRGKIVERGYTKPPSLHDERLRTAPVGRLFAIITEGYGAMPAYGWQIPPEDRWAIVAYLRALQLSQHFPTSKVTPAMRSAFNVSADTGGVEAPPAKEEVPR